MKSFLQTKKNDSQKVTEKWNKQWKKREKSVKNSKNDKIICFRLVFEKYVVCFIDFVKTNA